MVRSVFGSTLFSFLSSAISYVLILTLARAYDPVEFARYLYLMAWASLSVNVIDCASEQCVVHFSTSRNIPIEQAWGLLFWLKVVVLSSSIVVATILSFSGWVDVPVATLLCLLPAFYVAPVYEVRRLNQTYAGILLVEKFFYFLLVLLVLCYSLGVWYVVVVYFVASAGSLLTQAFKVRVAIGLPSQANVRRLRGYIFDYFPAYLVLLSQLLYGNVSRLIVEAKQGPILFASISLALQLINAVSIVQTQVDRHIRPDIMEAISLRQRSRLFGILRRYLYFYLGPLTALATCISLSAEAVVVLLFGESWRAAGEVLKIMSPLIVTVACLRLIDMLSIPLGVARLNLSLNISLGALLFLLLWFNPWSEQSLSYVIIIVAVQIFHVISMTGLTAIFGSAYFLVAKKAS